MEYTGKKKRMPFKNVQHFENKKGKLYTATEKLYDYKL